MVSAGCWKIKRERDQNGIGWFREGGEDVGRTRGREGGREQASEREEERARDWNLSRSYWSTGNYEKRVNQQNRTFFVQHCEDSHRKARDELAGVKLLLILPLLV